MYYNICGSACPATCGPAALYCTANCVSDCFCVAGYVLAKDGKTCIRVEDCPPQDDQDDQDDDEEEDYACWCASKSMGGCDCSNLSSCQQQAQGTYDQLAEAEAAGYQIADLVPVSCQPDGTYSIYQDQGMYQYCADPLTGNWIAELEWVDGEQKCVIEPEVCVGGQVWDECNGHCLATCEEKEPICTEHCEPGCTCKRGMFWDDSSKTCVAEDMCPGNNDNTNTCEYGMVFDMCKGHCLATCNNPTPTCTMACEAGCVCPGNTVFDTIGKACIPYELCGNNEQEDCYCSQEEKPCDCDNLSNCQQQAQDAHDRLENAMGQLVGVFIPDCQPNGDFSEIQFYGSTGQIFCVDPETGAHLVDAEWYETIGKGGETVSEYRCDYDSQPDPVPELTKCQQEAQEIEDMLAESDYMIADLNPPSCDDEGNYEHFQLNTMRPYCADPLTGEFLAEISWDKNNDPYCNYQDSTTNPPPLPALDDYGCIIGQEYYAKWSKKCVKNKCICENGKPPSICPENRMNLCESCNQGYKLFMDRCDEDFVLSFGKAMLG